MRPPAAADVHASHASCRHDHTIGRAKKSTRAAELQPCVGAITGARIEIVDGPDAGVSATSKGGGYRLENINWGTFRMRASRSGYETAETTVDAQPPGSGNPPAPARVSVHFR